MTVNMLRKNKKRNKEEKYYRLLEKVASSCAFYYRVKKADLEMTSVTSSEKRPSLCHLPYKYNWVTMFLDNDAEI